MAKAEQGLDEYSSESESSNPAKAEESKKEKIAVALTYGTASATVPASFDSPATLACPAAEQRTNSPPGFILPGQPHVEGPNRFRQPARFRIRRVLRPGARSSRNILRAIFLR
jgi:hypothetical protein